MWLIQLWRSIDKNPPEHTGFINGIKRVPCECDFTPTTVQVVCCMYIFTLLSRFEYAYFRPNFCRTNGQITAHRAPTHTHTHTCVQIALLINYMHSHLTRHTHPAPLTALTCLSSSVSAVCADADAANDCRFDRPPARIERLHRHRRLLLTTDTATDATRASGAIAQRLTGETPMQLGQMRARVDVDVR